MATTYPQVTTSLSIPEVTRIIREEGDKRDYMGLLKRTASLMAPGGLVDWYTPDHDPFIISRDLGKPAVGVGIKGVGWNALFYLWDHGHTRIIEVSRSAGIDSGPAKKLCQRILDRIG